MTRATLLATPENKADQADQENLTDQENQESQVDQASKSTAPPTCSSLISPRDILVGVSGASGMPLAACLLRCLADMPHVRIHCAISQGAHAVLHAECASGPELLTQYAHHVYPVNDMGAGPSSGSWWRRGAEPAAMILTPCSMGTLGAIASGATRNLVQRSADVALKERLPLVLVTRESPLSAIHLRNMLALHKAGAVIMPLSPGFYLKPQSVDDLLRHFCGRIFDQVGLPHDLGRWTGE